MRKLLQLLTCVAVLLPTGASAARNDHFQVEINKGQMIRLERTASSIIVADPAIADIQVVSPRMVYVQAKKIGETSLYVIDSRDATIMDATIEVTHNISKLNRAAKQLIPDADVEFRTVDGGLVVNGYAGSIQDSDRLNSLASTFIGKDDKLVNMVSTAGSDQVTLMVRIAEVSRNELKRFGIHMENVLSPGNFIFNIAQGRDFMGAAGTLGSGTLARTGNDNSLFAGWRNGNTSIQSVIDALETQGLVSVLAEPNLTTTSGKPANFLAGGEFPIPIVDSDGKVNVQYKPFGISLNFTPVVMSKEKISLTVAPEVSSISSVDSLQLSSSTTFTIPSLQTRRAETTVELGSGQTFAIAGLLKNDRTNNINKFPGLGDMPVLGALFRSQEFQNDQSELVILVTPYIARAVAERGQMKSPLDGYMPPTDLERLMRGKLYEEQAPAGAPVSDAPASGGKDNAGTAHSQAPQETTPRLNGEGGFMLE